MNFNELLTDEEKAAISVLEAGGFKAFTEAKLEDVRELATGKRRRTFRNQGRYHLVLACRNLIGRTLPDPGLQSDSESAPPKIVPPTELKPVADMLKEDLLAEARTYPELTGESRMNKAELAAAVQAQRDRRALIHRSFKE
ncbi:hypothetical protein [uncultured Desulfosarcina sp.]|uniref:hypothetical protein n=1 Tax=uncultured Desulfosarcina sp. TaxID=218289 RepID=UPI0029C62F16|nr:hypothetical protein [uncultured Desulfosarcina sp.]